MDGWAITNSLVGVAILGCLVHAVRLLAEMQRDSHIIKEFLRELRQDRLEIREILADSVDLLNYHDAMLVTQERTLNSLKEKISRWDSWIKRNAVLAPVNDKVKDVAGASTSR